METTTTQEAKMDSYTVEADRKSSTHTGMVFGQYRCDADDRKPRIVGWWVLRDGKRISYFRLRKQAQAFIARQVEAAS